MVVSSCVAFNIHLILLPSLPGGSFISRDKSWVLISKLADHVIESIKGDHFGGTFDCVHLRGVPLCFISHRRHGEKWRKLDRGNKHFSFKLYEQTGNIQCACIHPNKTCITVCLWDALKQGFTLATVRMQLFRHHQWRLCLCWQMCAAVANNCVRLRLVRGTGNQANTKRDGFM